MKEWKKVKEKRGEDVLESEGNKKVAEEVGDERREKCNWTRKVKALSPAITHLASIAGKRCTVFFRV